MPLKQVSQTAPVIYTLTDRDVPRVGALPPGGGISYFWFSAVDTNRIYTYYHDFFRGLFCLKDPNYPGDFQIMLALATKEDEWPSWDVIREVWDGRTGAYLGRDERSVNLGTFHMFSAPDGSIWSTDFSLNLNRIDPVTWLAEPWPINLLEFGNNIGSSYGGMSALRIAVDPQRDVALIRLSHNAGHQLSVCRLSTGDWIRDINICGTVEYVFIATPPLAYAVDALGVLTAFNYDTGVANGALHTGLVSGSFDWSRTAFTWDPFTRRILYGHNPGDTLPEGHCNTKVTGYYPLALPVGMTPPIPLKYPQKGKTVAVWSRVYGGTSEGIAGQELTYTVGTGSTATIAPARKATESNGTVTVQLTSTDAGANSVTTQTTVP